MLLVQEWLPGIRGFRVPQASISSVFSRLIAVSRDAGTLKGESWAEPVFSYACQEAGNQKYSL